MPLVEAISSHPLLPNASTPTTLPRGSRPTPAQSGGSGRAISPRASGRLPTTHHEREHPSPAGGLRRCRERIGPSGRDELSAHILPRFQANRAVCANSSIARGQANLPAKNDLAGGRRWMGTKLLDIVALFRLVLG